MGMWDTAFGLSPIIKYFKEQIDLLRAAAGFDVELDLSAKLDKPGSFPVGNFATYNPTTEAIENSGFNGESFVPAEEGKGLSTNDFTDEYKGILDNLGELPGSDDKMNTIKPTAGNIGDIIVLDANGQPAVSGYKPGGMFSQFEQVIDPLTTVPSTPAFGLLPVAAGMLSAVIFYCISVDAEPTRKRAGSVLVLFNGTDTPDNVLQLGGDAGNAITGNLYFTISADYLTCNYELVDANFSTRISLKILTL